MSCLSIFTYYCIGKQMLLLSSMLYSKISFGLVHLCWEKESKSDSRRKHASRALWTPLTELLLFIVFKHFQNDICRYKVIFDLYIQWIISEGCSDDHYGTIVARLLVSEWGVQWIGWVGRRQWTWNITCETCFTRKKIFS